MLRDDLTWLSSELGFAELIETESGLSANEAAQRALGNIVATGIVEAVSTLLGTSSDVAQVQEIVAEARRGVRRTVIVGSNTVGGQRQRVLGVPAAAGRARVLIIPDVWEEAESLQRRAGLVDVAAAVSHEVANAMAAIGGWADLAVRPNQAGVDPIEALRLIASCAKTAEGAARRLLSLARGQMDDSGEATCNASDLTSEVVDLLSLSARQARVTLTANVEPALSVPAERSQLFTVVWNLTKNALEACAPAGLVEVSLQGDETAVILLVKDTGSGFDATQKERIFAPYFTTKANGTGLGLALVRQTVESVGGQISVDSIPGRGTTFRVELPRVVRPSALHTPIHSDVVRTQSAPPEAVLPLDASILVVDDDNALREMVATALSLRGARVTTAATSAEAKAVEGTFDIALIDMMLDDCRGDELLAVLRKKGTVNAAMLVTGTVQKPKLVPGGEPDDWVRKPFELSHLFDRVKRTLERHRMLNAATATATARL